MKANLLLIVHFHQPVGNFDFVIKDVYERCYKPFLDTICRYPRIKWNLHFSGSLLEWFESNEPEILEIIRGLVKSGQVELMGGAMYEPILSVIPEEDSIGQIELMRQYVASLFNNNTKGAWIPERVWEPHLASTLAKAGVEYIVLDDTHLIYAGVKKEDTYGYYVTEDNSSVIRVFPSDKPLRYTIPFRRQDESFAYMKKVAARIDAPIFTYGDDAEKFGSWPDTYKLVYEDRWLAKFLEALLKNDNWLGTLTLSECVKNFPPLARIYIPAASYEEMLKWALPVDAEAVLQKVEDELESKGKKEEYSPFLRGGFFRNFFTKYYETNQMHKRMLYAGNLLRGIKKDNATAGRLKDATKELYKSQSNCAYWHGLFGGLYLYHLRRAAYEHILKAEAIYNEITKNAERPKCEIVDFDADAFDEVILQNKRIWLCVKPSGGGSVVELDVKEKAFNLLNVLTRYREFYHETMADIPHDRYRRAMLVDHFFGKETTLEDFEKGDYKERGDFIDSSYGFKAAKGGNRLVMKRRGSAYGLDTSIAKELILTKSGLNIIYKITNLGRSKKSFRFATEIPFIMPDANAPRYLYFLNDERDKGLAVDSRGSLDGLRSFKIVDTQGKLRLSLDFSKECALWRFPIETLSRSEKGCEKNYQGSVIAPNWRFTLMPDETFSVKFSLKIEISAVSHDSSRWKKEASIQL